ncbi:MAG: ABC transporter permease [Lachnospiraceae bacterium]|nr:ABC transporter permease [Lachnospiraceae bacterium]
MHKVLRKRVFRSLKKHALRYFMLGLMIVMGIFLVVSIVASAETLTKGTEDMAAETVLEDGEFETLNALNDDEIKKLEDMGVMIRPQFYFDHVLDKEEDGTLRIMKVRTDINKIRYVSGRAPESDDEAVLEKRYAEVHDLSVGDSIVIGDVTYRISGLGVVSDYDAPLKDMSDTAVNSEIFGLIFMTDKAYEDYKASGIAQKAEVNLYAYKTDGNPDIKKFKKEIPGLTSFCKQEENTRIFATKNDKVVDIETGLVAGVIVLILMAYVISVFVVHSIESESSIIGTLYAMGVTKKDLLLHYISLPVVVTLISGVLGLLLSATGIMADMTAESCYEYFSIPEFDLWIPSYLWVYSVVCPPVIAVIVNLIAVNRKLDRTALSLIRNEAGAGKVSKIGLKHMNFVSAFRIRQMLREMRSTVAVVLGMFFALLVFMISVDCYSLCSNIGEDFAKDTKFEYMYVLKFPLTEVPEGAEKAYAYSCKKKIYGYSFDVTMLGLEENDVYFNVRPEKSLQDVVVSSAFAEKFGLTKGEEFVITDEEKERKYAFSVSGITAYAPGFYIFMDIDELRNMMGKSEGYYNVLFSDEALDIEPAYIYSTITRDDIVKGSTVFSDLMMPMIYTLSFASAVIFCVVLYLMMKVMIDRSSQNISLIKVFGYRRKEIRKLYLDGNFYIIAIGALLAVPLSKILMNSMFPFMISNVSCGLNLNTPKLFYVVLYGVIILLYLFINILLVRRLDRYSPAEVLKNRE